MHVMNLSFILTVIYVCLLYKWGFQQVNVCSAAINGTRLYAMNRELLLISCQCTRVIGASIHMSSPLPDELMALSVISFTVSCNFLQIKADSKRLPFKTEDVSATNPSFIPCVSIANCQPEASHQSPREGVDGGLKMANFKFEVGVLAVPLWIAECSSLLQVSHHCGNGAQRHVFNSELTTSVGSEII